MTRPVKNVAESVRAKLLSLAKRRDEEFTFTLLRYVNERLLFRLSTSPSRTRFALKGAALFSVWGGSPHRATRDLDLHGKGTASEDALRAQFAQVLELPVEDDGVRFDLASLKVAPIRGGQKYAGWRVTLTARVGAARVPVQVDVGFGDAVTPGIEEVEYPSMLIAAPVSLLAYPKETVVAEKAEAMVSLGLPNTRMKDFFDLRELARRFVFDGATLVAAFRATFSRRGTEFPSGLPVALTPAFFGATARIARWTAFVLKVGLVDAGTLEETNLAVADFILRPLAAAADINTRWSAQWKPGGPWR